jgi:hypothetical protein
LSGIALVRIGAAALALAVLPAAHPASAQTFQHAAGQDALPIRDRHVDTPRKGAAADLPRSEGDQAVVAGWPLYRTERGQEAFNAAMATLKATDSAAPAPRAFGGCVGLECNLSLPLIGADGWIPAGRIWVSPTEYVLIVHSPRLREGQSYRRRSQRDMRYFIFHEFLNSTHNTDPYDTISAHSGTVFVPFYMSKQWTDARGRRFVIVVQVAPYDVVSLHATDKGSAGPGIEVAKNTSDALQPLQALAGILVAAIAKTASPQLMVVHHRGVEGLPMLNAYKRRLAILRDQPRAPTVALPFMPARPERIARATAGLHDLILPRDGSAATPVAHRGFLPPRDQAAGHTAGQAAEQTAVSAIEPMRATSLSADPVPVLVGPVRLATRPPPPMLVEPLRPASRPVRAPAFAPGR